MPKEKINYTNQELAQLFLKHFSDNYNKANHDFARIFGAKQMKYNPDHFHNALVKSHRQIERKGFYFPYGLSKSGYTFMGYILRAVQNEIMNNGEVDLVDHNVQIESPDQDATHEALLYNQDEHLGEINDHILEETLIHEIYEYVCRRYIPKEAGMFKFYFMTNYSYQTIANISGYSVATIHKAVSKIKKDVQQAFRLRRLK